MSRKNARSRPSNQRWKESKGNKGRWTPPPPIEEMVVPSGRCYFAHRKLQFTKQQATLALSQAQQTRLSRGQEGQEKRAYECDCGWWHLTSWTEPPPPRTSR